MNPLELLRPDGCSTTRPNHPVRALGIDLGTTNSTVTEAVWQPSQTDVNVCCLEVDQETLSGTYTHLLVPSAVAIHDGKMLVGEGAKRLAGGLQSGRSFVIPDQKEQASETTDFDLVTWLVIKKP